MARRPAAKAVRAAAPRRAALSRPQWAIYEAGWQAGARFRVAVCGRRFGKTYLAPEEIRRAARLAVQNNVPVEDEIWYGAPTFRQAKRAFWGRLKRAIPREWLAGKPNESECSITLASGHVIRIVGLDNYDALRGSGLWFFVGDEWQDAKPEAWTETIRPMLSTAKGHALFIGTPKGFDDFRDKFLLGQPGALDAEGNPVTDWKSWQFTTIQGGNVKPDEIAAARANLDPRTYRQEYEASFETYSGRVVFAFNRAHHVRPCAYDPSLPISVGMDFNVNPMSAVVIQTHGGVDHIIDEIVIPTSSTDDMVAEIRRRYARGGAVGHITVFPDPAGNQRRTSAAGRTDISILRDAGFRVEAMSAHPPVRDRLNVTNARFEAADGTRSIVVDPRCAKLCEALERLVYKDGTSEPDKGGGYDHLVDALGYYLFPRYGKRPAHAVQNVNLFGR